MPVVVELTGYIKPVEGMYVSFCNELGITTSAATPEEAMRRTQEMIEGYFAACRKLGTYEQVVAKLTGQAVGVVSKIQLRTAFSVQQEQVITV